MSDAQSTCANDSTTSSSDKYDNTAGDPTFRPSSSVVPDPLTRVTRSMPQVKPRSEGDQTQSHHEMSITAAELAAENQKRIQAILDSQRMAEDARIEITNHADPAGIGRPDGKGAQRGSKTYSAIFHEDRHRLLVRRRGEPLRGMTGHCKWPQVPLPPMHPSIRRPSAHLQLCHHHPRG